jgi:Ser/Thr protein kinase RdoA (MazF antagonist)
MSAAASVLSAYSADVIAGPWELLLNTTGFSGARIWRSAHGWRLKSWPCADVAAEHLRDTHAWMRHAAVLDFIPRVEPTRTGDTIVVDDAWIWDIVTWRPGEPLSHRPSPARLAAAGRAVAQLHNIWQTHPHRRAGVCPAVWRRLDALKRIPAIDDSPARNLIATVRRLAVGCASALIPWRGNNFGLQPCLCDLRADHVLFTGDQVTGIIDFGSAKIDHPMADLARLLGDCQIDNIPGQPLLDAYHAIRPLSGADYAMIAALERTGAVVALLTWIERGKVRSLSTAEHERVAKIAARCERLVGNFANG